MGRKQQTEGIRRITVSYSLPESTVQSIEDLKKDSSVSKSAIVESLIREGLKIRNRGIGLMVPIPDYVVDELGAVCPDNMEVQEYIISLIEGARPDDITYAKAQMKKRGNNGTTASTKM